MPSKADGAWQMGNINRSGELELIRIRGGKDESLTASCSWRSGAVCNDSCPAFFEYYNAAERLIVRLECMPRAPMVIHVRRDGRVHSAEKDLVAASAGKRDHGLRGPWDE